MGITHNQRNFLETRGINVEGWTYEQASAKISELKQAERGGLDYKPKTTYPKRTEYVDKPAYMPDRVPAYMPDRVPAKPFEAHLSIEQVRHNALQIALGLTKIPNDERVLLDVADNIVHWMLSGTRKEAEK